MLSSETRRDIPHLEAYSPPPVEELILKGMYGCPAHRLHREGRTEGWGLELRGRVLGVFFTRMLYFGCACVVRSVVAPRPPYSGPSGMLESECRNSQRQKVWPKCPNSLSTRAASAKHAFGMRRYETMVEEVDLFREWYRPHNERLYKLLGRELAWR